MKINVHTVTDVGRTLKGAPGDPEWRNEIDRDLHRLYEKLAGDLLEIGVGAEYSEGTAKHVRAMVVAYGAGSGAGGERIFAGPPGRRVWNDSLTGKHPSRSEDVYDLPGGFNQEGNDFVNRAVEDIAPIFQKAVAEMWQNIPASVWESAAYLI